MKKTMSKVLVTGGAGFVGGHLGRRLLSRGVEVVVLDDLSSGLEENVPDGAQFILGDIRNPEQVARAMEGCDTVFHLAARVESRQSIMDPADCYSVNISGTAAVVAECLDGPGRRLIFASSAAVYPLDADKPLREEQAVLGLTPYAVSKRVGEQTIKMYSQSHGLSGCSLRCFNVYGPGQRGDSPYSAVISRFLGRIRCGEPMQLFGGGTQKRDFIHVDDAVDAYILAAESNATGPFNVGTGEAVSVKHIAERLIEASGEGSYRTAPPVHGDAPYSCADISLIRERLGFSPGISVGEGLKTLFG